MALLKRTDYRLHEGPWPNAFNRTVGDVYVPSGGATGGVRWWEGSRWSDGYRGVALPGLWKADSYYRLEPADEAEKSEENEPWVTIGQWGPGKVFHKTLGGLLPKTDVQPGDVVVSVSANGRKLQEWSGTGWLPVTSVQDFPANAAHLSVWRRGATPTPAKPGVSLMDLFDEDELREGGWS